MWQRGCPRPCPTHAAWTATISGQEHTADLLCTHGDAPPVSLSPHVTQGAWHSSAMIAPTFQQEVKASGLDDATGQAACPRAGAGGSEAGAPQCPSFTGCHLELLFNCAGLALRLSAPNVPSVSSFGSLEDKSVAVLPWQASVPMPLVPEQSGTPARERSQ